MILLSLSQYEPVVRIYDRESTFFSTGLAEFSYNNIHSSADYMAFLKKDNILIRVESSIILYKTSDPMLVVNTNDLPSDFDLNSYYNKILTFNLTFSDFLGNNQTVPLEMIIVSNDSDGTISTLPLSMNQELIDSSFAVNIYYSCGEYELEVNNTLLEMRIDQIKTNISLFNFDSLFVGEYADLELLPLEGSLFYDEQIN